MVWWLVVCVVAVVAAVVAAVVYWLFGQGGGAADKEKVGLAQAPAALVREIEYYAEFAALVFDTQQTPHCRDFCQSVQRTRAHARLFHLKDRNELVVSFGTGHLPTREAYGKSQFPMTDNPGVSVHANAQKAALELLGGVAPLLDATAAGTDPRLTLVGHSMGGAVATLMAPFLVMFCQAKPSRIRVFTFNQPRVGNRAFAEYYNRLALDFTRVVNKDDPVADYPSQEDGWHHVHREVWVGHDNVFYQCNNVTFQDPKCSQGKSSFKAYANHTRLAGKETFRRSKDTKPFSG